MKKVLLGFVLGIGCMLTTTAIAAAINVTAVLPGDITFKIDGKNKAADSEMPVLNYNDRVYVPIRYAAELLGCSVDWDIVKRQVVIESPEPLINTVEKIVEVEKIVYVDSSEDSGNDKTVYSTIPIKFSDSKTEISMTRISPDPVGGFTTAYIYLKNKGDGNIQLEPSKSTLVVDGQEYGLLGLQNYYDQRWYGDIDTNDEHDGFLRFKPTPEDWENGTLTVSVRRTLGSKVTTEKYTFNFLNAFTNK